MTKQLPGAEDQALMARAATIAEHFGVPIQTLRYASYRFHNGQHWTRRDQWERFVNGQWQLENWQPKQHSSF